MSSFASGIVYSILIIAVASLCTIATRALPFAVFGGKREMPGTLRRLTTLLPPAIIAVLVVYCLKGLSLEDSTGLAATIVALAAVVILHIWKKNTLLSIASGTIIYMVLIRII